VKTPPPATITPQRRVLVIGLGNPYRSDDALGLVVAQYLRQAPQAHVTIVDTPQDGTALLELWRDADVVVLIDAVSSGAEPGTLYRFDAGLQPLPTHFASTSTHALGVAEAIELARALRQLPPALIVYGVEGQTFAPGMGLSEAVASRIQEVVKRVQRDLTYAPGDGG